MSVLTRRNLLHAGFKLSIASLVAARTAHAGTLFDLHMKGFDPSRDPGKHQEQIEVNPECAYTIRGANSEKIAATWTQCSNDRRCAFRTDEIANPFLTGTTCEKYSC